MLSRGNFFAEKRHNNKVLPFCAKGSCNYASLCCSGFISESDGPQTDKIVVTIYFLTFKNVYCLCNNCSHVWYEIAQNITIVSVFLKISWHYMIQDPQDYFGKYVHCSCFLHSSVWHFGFIRFSVHATINPLLLYVAHSFLNVVCGNVKLASNLNCKRKMGVYPS